MIENTQQDNCPIFYQAMLVIGENPDKAEWVSDFSDKRIIVIKNPKSIIKNVPIVTVCSDDSAEALRKYTRVEKVTDIRIT